VFTDELTISVRSGDGSRGCDSYLRRPDRKRIPNGGDGGKGGDVILRADDQAGSLSYLKSKRLFEAERGGLGTSNNQHGRSGEDIVVKVPCGTTVTNKRDNLLIRDLLVAGEEIIVVKGGRGGYGNHKGRPPTPGEEGKVLELSLSFKIIADIFLVGLPNSGKTSLLKRLTHAGVLETDYPFATKSPQLGTYQTDASEFRICELPAIYDASSEGRGLGTRWLKHLERAKLLFLLVDPKSTFAPDVTTGHDILLKIIKQVEPKFLSIPRFLIVNKAHLISEKKTNKNRALKDTRTFFISAQEGTGVNRLMKEATEILEKKSETAIR
jgi:GTPase